MILECSTSRNTELSHQNLDFSRNYLNELFRSTSRADTSPERAATVAQSFQNYRKAQIQCWSDLWGLVDSWIYPATHPNFTWIQRKIIKFYRKIVNSREKASNSVAWASGVIQTCSDKVGIPSGSNQQCISSFLIENGMGLAQISVSELILLIFRWFLPDRQALYQLVGLPVAVIELPLDPKYPWETILTDIDRSAGHFGANPANNLNDKISLR